MSIAKDEFYWVTSLKHVDDTEWIGSIDPKQKMQDFKQCDEQG